MWVSANGQIEVSCLCGDRVCVLNRVVLTNESGKQELSVFADMDVDVRRLPSKLGQSLLLCSVNAATFALDSSNLAVCVDSNSSIVNNVELSARLAVDKGAQQELVSGGQRSHAGCGE